MFKRLGEHHNPLTLGHLYETAVEIALIAGDAEEARVHFKHMHGLYATVGSSSLAQRCDVLRAAIDALAGDAPTAAFAAIPQEVATNDAISSNVSLLADSVLATKGQPLTVRAAAALRALAASVRAVRVALAIVEYDAVKVPATLDGQPTSPGLGAFLAQRLAYERSDPDTVVSGAETSAQSRSATLQEGAHVYTLVLLSQPDAAGTELIGLAALGGIDGPRLAVRPSWCG